MPIRRVWSCDRFISAGAARPRAARERIIGEVLAMTEAEASEQLETVLKDFEARHWQTRRVFMTRYDAVAAAHDLDGAAIGDDQAPADRRLFLPRVQLCRRGADEPQRGAAFRPERDARGVGRES